MNDKKSPLEEFAFRCKPHFKPAQVFCTEESCEEKILCYVCIRNGHPHPEDKYQNFVEIIRQRAPGDGSNQLQVEKAHEQYKSNTQSIEKLNKQLKAELSWYEHLSKEVETNFKNLRFNLEPAEAIASELKIRATTHEGAENVIVDGPEVSQLINRFMRLGNEGQTNSTERDKTRLIQKKAELILIDFIKKFEQLTNELSFVTGIKPPRDTQPRKKKSDTVIQSPTQYAPKASFKSAEENNKGKSSDTPKSDANVKKISNFPSKTDQKSITAMDIEKPTQITKKTGPEQLEENKMEVVPNEKANEQSVDPREELKQRIKTFFSGSRKEKLALVEDCIRVAENLTNLDADTKAVVARQKATIELYNKTLKGLDITVVNKEAIKFLADSKNKKRSLHDFQQNIQKQRVSFLEEFKNWVDDVQMLDLLELMNKSSVEFSEQETELRDRLKNFTVAWREIEPKLEAKRNEKLQCNDIEATVQKLWGFRVRVPPMEKLLNMYFASKEIKISIKYLHARFKQLELDRCNLFREDMKEAEVLSIAESCKVISLANATAVMNKAMEWIQRVDFGTEYTKLSKLIEDTEQTKKSVVELLKAQKWNAETIPTSDIQVTRCMHQLYFDEMLEFRNWYLKNKKNPAPDAKKNSISNYLQTASSTLVSTFRKSPEESKMEIETQGTNSLVKGAKNTLSKETVQWVVEVANHIIQALETAKQFEKAKEILEMRVKFESENQFLSPLYKLFKANSTNLFRNYEGAGLEALESLLSRGRALGLPANEDVKSVFDYLNTVCWYISANAKSRGQRPTLELLEESLADLKRRNLSVEGNSLAKKRKEKIEKFKELRAEVQAFEMKYWLEDAKEGVRKLEQLEKIYVELGVEDPQTYKIIQGHLQEYRREVQVSPGQLTIENNISAGAKGLELGLADFAKTLANNLKEIPRKKKFFEKLAETKANLLGKFGNQEMESLTPRLKILNSNLFHGTKKVKNSELLKLLTSLEPSGTESSKIFLYWVLIAGMILRAKKGPFKIFEKLRKFSRNLLKSGAIQVDTPLYKKLLKEYLRAKSLHSELVCVQGAITAHKKPEGPSKRKFTQLNAEYLDGLLRRIKKGRLSAKAISQQISAILKQSRDHDKEFEVFEVRHRNGNRTMPSEYNKFVKKIDSSICISRKLDQKIEEILQKEKALKQELKDFGSDNFTPNALYARMLQFSTKSYAEHIIFSNSCEKFLANFRKYQPLFEEYQTIHQLQDQATLKQIMNLRQKLDEFEQSLSHLSKKKNIYQSGIHQIRKSLCRIRVLIIQNGVKGGKKDVKFTTADVRSLIIDMHNLNFERKNTFGRAEMVYIAELKKKIDTAVADVNKATSTNELEAIMNKTTQKFYGAIDFNQEYEAKKEELKKNVALIQSSIMPDTSNKSKSSESTIKESKASAEATKVSKVVEVINKIKTVDTTSVPKTIDNLKVSKPETPAKKPVMIDLELEPAVEEDPFEILEPIMPEPMEPKASSSAEAKKTISVEPEKTLPLFPIIPKVKIEGKERAPEKKSNNVVMIIDSDDEDMPKNSAPLKPESEGSKDDLLILENFVPSLSKKVKDNTSNPISVTPSSQENSQNVGGIINQVVEKEPKIRNRRKDFLLHTSDIAKVIRQSAQEDTSHKGESFWVDRFAQLLSKADELKSIFGLVTEDFDSDFFKLILHLPSDELSVLEKRAQEEVERGRMHNVSAKRIMFQLMRKGTAKKSAA